MYDPDQLKALSGPELHARRLQILDTIVKYERSWDDPNLPLELLQELAFVTGILRRSKTSGPPRAAKPTRRGNGIKSSSADLLKMIESA